MKKRPLSIAIAIAAVAGLGYIASSHAFFKLGGSSVTPTHVAGAPRTCPPVSVIQNNMESNYDQMNFTLEGNIGTKITFAALYLQQSNPGWVWVNRMNCAYHTANGSFNLIATLPSSVAGTAWFQQGGANSPATWEGSRCSAPGGSPISAEDCQVYLVTAANS